MTGDDGYGCVGAGVVLGATGLPHLEVLARRERKRDIVLRGQFIVHPVIIAFIGECIKQGPCTICCRIAEAPPNVPVVPRPQC